MKCILINIQNVMFKLIDANIFGIIILVLFQIMYIIIIKQKLNDFEEYII